MGVTGKTIADALKMSPKSHSVEGRWRFPPAKAAEAFDGLDVPMRPSQKKWRWVQIPAANDLMSVGLCLWFLTDSRVGTGLQSGVICYWHWCQEKSPFKVCVNFGSHKLWPPPSSLSPVSPVLFESVDSVIFCHCVCRGWATDVLVGQDSQPHSSEPGFVAASTFPFFFQIFIVR